MEKTKIMLCDTCPKISSVIVESFSFYKVWQKVIVIREMINLVWGEESANFIHGKERKIFIF